MRLRRPSVLVPAALVGALLVALPLSQVTETALELRVKSALGVGPADRGCQPARDVAGWSVLPDMPVVVDEPRAATVDGDVYLAGGVLEIVRTGGPEPKPGIEYTEVRSSRTLLRFDPSTRRYERLADMPVALNHTAAVAHDGRLYLVGGHGRLLRGAEPLDVLLRYDPATDRWTRLAPMPTPRGAIAAGVVGDRLYVAGGMDGSGGPVAALEAYDFTTGRWTELAPLPRAREHVAGAVADGAFYALGGRGRLDWSLRDATRYLPEEDRWERLPDLPVGTGGAEAVVVDGDPVLLGGGNDLRAEVYGAVQRFDTATGRWRLMPGGMRQPRHGLSAVTIGSRVLTFGGSPCAYFAATPTADVLDARRLPS